MAPLHTSEYNRTPRQAQAVTVPWGRQLSEGVFFHLMAYLLVGNEHQAIPGRHALSLMCWKNSSEKQEERWIRAHMGTLAPG